MSNICTRCGRERIASKVWIEVVEYHGRTSKIEHSEYVCVDQSCQTIVEKQLLVIKEKRQSMEKQKEEQKQARKRSIHLNHLKHASL